MIGKSISQYHIIEKLGGGGMGVVYKAEDTKLQRTVALKFLNDSLVSEDEARGRFLLEAQAASKLDHPNICTIYEINETGDGQMYIAMSFCDGESLKEKVGRGPMRHEEGVNIALQIARGLSCAHEAGIVHRDIKPANIMLTAQGVVKVVDFGLAKLIGMSRLTQVGATAGTIAYMSPEQCRGETLDQRTDVWAVGVVLYEMLTGRLPFAGDYEQVIIYSILNSDPGSITEHTEDIPPDIERIVNKCLEKDPAKRYASASELADDLERALRGEKPEASRERITVGFPIQFSSPRARRVLKLVAGVITALALLLLLPTVRGPVQDWLNVSIIPDEKYLAILPLTNVGDDPANQAFCDGLVETLTSKLTQLQLAHGSLWVVAASEVRERKITSVSRARKDFGVTLGLTGSVQRSKDRIRLTLNLVDAKTSRQLRSTIADETGSTLAVLQDRAVSSIAEMLQLELDPGALHALTAGNTTVGKAYDFYLQGRGYLQRYEKMENLTNAITLFERALQEDREYALAYAGLGEAYWRKYELSKDSNWIHDAVADCNRSLELDGKLPQAHVTLGLIYRGTGRYEAAVDEFKKALEVDPVNSDALRGLGGAYEDLGQLSMAESTYKKAIDLSRTYWAGYNRLGVFYYRQGRYDDAVEQFKQVVALTPDNFRGYNNLGGLFFVQNKWNEAEKLFKRSIEVEPNYTAYSQLGTLYYFRHLYKEAAQAYKQALKIQDSDYRVWGNLASAYARSADNENAKQSYQKAASLAEGQRALNPRDGVVLCDLAGYYERLNRKKEALTLIREAVALASNDVDVMGRAGRLFELLGNRQAALEWIEKALKHGYMISELEKDPELRDLHNDEQFKKLVAAK